MIELESTYNPKQYEKKWWSFWIERKLFHATPDPTKKPYGILMPPPNVTSQLHMGHGTCYTFMDLLIRWKRMKGFSACWLPGTDHAGIATQMMVERDLWDKENKRRQDIGREAFEKRCQDWKEKYGGVIYQQFAEIGFSADWDRKAYTMDPHLSKAVRYVFVKLFEEGLIYRGERLVNWDPVMKTAVSDDEVYNQDVSGHLWHIKYPIEGSEEFITIATTRPETMLGDSAIAVSPTDERYTHLVGKKARIPFANRLIPIIADDYVKSEFGTGAVKITPAHDPNDFAIGKRHNLEFLTIFTDEASMNDTVPERFRGMDRFVARKEIIKGLKAEGLLEKEESYKHSVPHSDRSKSVIEPKLSKQWYVSMKELAKPAAEAAQSGELGFVPDTWKKTYLYWLENIQDWCISRQLWWGHRIPIWYCDACDSVETGLADPTACKSCGSKSIRQDEDVLDTWFSSQLWPLSPFGWPDAAKEKQDGFDYFYPTNVLITAPEIIFLWVARMVMMGLKFKGQIPFKDIYFSATVTDKQGRKFSKTLGNGIDPIEVIEKHGADAVRFTGVSMAPLGGRISMDKSDFEHGARFVNKLWNAARFLFNYLEPTTTLQPISALSLDVPSKWLITRFADTTEKVNQNLETYRLNDAVDQTYHFIWGAFCDWGLECAKSALNGNDEKAKQATLSVLVYILDGALRLIHPIMPFVSEELWQKLPHHPDWDRPQSLCVAKFPEASDLKRFDKEADEWQAVTNLISGVRSARQQVGISPKTQLELHVKTSQELAGLFKSSEAWIKRLANVSSLLAGPSITRPAQSLSDVGKGYESYIPAAGLVDFEKEKQRITVEIGRLSKIVDGLDKKLGNESFVARAPEEVVAETKAQKQNLEAQLRGLRANLASIT